MIKVYNFDTKRLLQGLNRLKILGRKHHNFRIRIESDGNNLSITTTCNYNIYALYFNVNVTTTASVSKKSFNSFLDKFI